jgi:hypothetical protein
MLRFAPNWVACGLRLGQDNPRETEDKIREKNFFAMR